jgi:hypothetical protein
MGAFARSSLQSPERCQRARPARREAAEKAAALSPRRARARRGSRSARSRRRAVKHGAVGGRMTARWSGVFRGERRRRCAPWRISKRNAGGFPTALGGQSPKRVFLRRVHVSETSVVEADSKHLGGASKESRKALRGAHRQATGRQKGPDGAPCHSLRARVRRLVEAERRIRALDRGVLQTCWCPGRASAVGPPAAD